MNLSKIYRKISKYLKNRNYRFQVNASLGLYNFLDDKTYIERMYKCTTGKELDLNNPKTYNEKLQWLKLNDRNPLYTELVDKYKVKDYIAKMIGEEYIIPTLGVWDSFEDIDFDKLPDKFVLKCTHDSGGVVICKSKDTFNISQAKKVLTKALNRNYFYTFREWPYKYVKPRIIAEEYIEDLKLNELRDYKFLAFNGEIKTLFIVTDRAKGNSEMKLDFYDKDFTHLPFTRKYPNANISPEKPMCFDLMKELAEKLSTNIPHVRIDFYEVNDKVYFGEMTFFPGSGYEQFEPKEWDYKLGEWIDLSLVNKNTP